MPNHSSLPRTERCPSCGETISARLLDTRSGRSNAIPVAYRPLFSCPNRRASRA